MSSLGKYTGPASQIILNICLSQEHHVSVQDVTDLKFTHTELLFEFSNTIYLHISVGDDGDILDWIFPQLSNNSMKGLSSAIYWMFLLFVELQNWNWSFPKFFICIMQLFFRWKPHSLTANVPQVVNEQICLSNQTHHYHRYLC